MFQNVLMQGRLFSGGETSLLSSLEVHLWNCKHTHANTLKTNYAQAEHPTGDAIQQLLHALATPCEVQDFTMHNSAALHHSWLCSQVRQTTPDHTQQCSWLWSVGQQTWTFQPIEVSETILTPYLIKCGVVHKQSRRHLESTKPCQWWTSLQLAGTSKYIILIILTLNITDFLTMQTHA